MYNKTKLDNILYNTINQLINEGKNKASRELLLEGDDRLKKVKRIIQQSFSGTSLNTDGPVSSAEYYVGNKGANTTWMDYLLYSVRHTFGLMDNKDLPLLVKVAKIAFDELEFEKSENHIDELNTLKAIVNLLKKDANAANRVIKDPNVTYEKLYNEYANVLKQLKNDMRYRVNSKKYQKNQRYEIMPIDDFNTANELGKYTGTGNGSGALCYTQSKNTWDGYTRGGINQCYLCYTTDFKEVEPRVTEGYPKDEYGLSMIWLFVNGDGELTNSNVRWNHGNRDFENVDNMFTTEEISDIVGVNFYETFRPNNKWAKKVEEALYRLKNGEYPYNVFDEYGGDFYEGFAIVQLSGRYNHINTNGELLSPNMWFDWCGKFSEGFSAIKVGQKWNYINTNGELLNPNQWFDWCRGFNKGFAAVNLGDSWYFINTDGNIVSDAVQQMIAQGVPLDSIFDVCDVFQEGFAWVCIGDRYNFINTNGEFLSPNRWFDDCYGFKNGFAAVRLNGSLYFINTDGNIISDAVQQMIAQDVPLDDIFDWYDNFEEGFAMVKLDGQYNYINTNGEFLKPNQWFDDCREFSGGFAAVQLNHKWNYINTNGEFLRPNMRFDMCVDFSEGFAAVKLNGKWNYINTNGEFLNPNMRFDRCGDFSEGFAVIQVDNRYNYISTNGELLSPNQWFDRCWNFSKGLAYVYLVNRWYTIDTKGQLYNRNGEPINSPLQENRRYRRDKKRVIRITESQLRNMIPFEKFINGCIDKSLRTYLNESLKTYDNAEFNIYDKLEELNISYDFINDWENILEIRTPNEGIKAKVRQLINYYGWKEIKDNGWSICAERIYGDNWNDFYDIEAEKDDDYPYGIGIYYHITLSRKVPKILRQGLTVREGNKLGYARGKRIYLMSYPDKEFAYSLFRNHKEKETEVTILLVDIRNYLGKQINIYHDDFTDGDECVYTYDYIPPQCIKVYDTFKIS